jgi:hypothetical protein
MDEKLFTKLLEMVLDSSSISLSEVQNRRETNKTTYNFAKLTRHTSGLVGIFSVHNKNTIMGSIPVKLIQI